MKKALSLLTASSIFFTASSQIWTRAENASIQKGKNVHIVGFVSNVVNVTDARGSTTLIGIEGKDSTRSLTLIVRSADRPKFKEAPETAYMNQYVQVKGKVAVYNGKSHIILHSDKQILITRDTSPEQEQ